MNVLVTGGAGYIGSETARLLSRKGFKVVVLDDLSTGNRSAVESLDLVEGNILDEPLLETVFSSIQFDAVVHFAGSKNVGESMLNPEKYWVNNVAGTATLLRQMAEHSVRKIVFSSSCSIYGNPSVTPVAEDSPIQPESIYAESKYICERLLHWYELQTGLQSVSLRYFNAAGASTDGKFGEDWRRSENLIPRVFQVAYGLRENLEIYGDNFDTFDGTAVRDYIHVADLAEAHLLALAYLANDGPSTALNLGTGTGLSVKQVVRQVELASKRPVRIKIIPRRQGDPARIFADATLALRTLGWKPRYGISEIAQTAMTWYSTLLAN